MPDWMWFKCPVSRISFFTSTQISMQCTSMKQHGHLHSFTTSGAQINHPTEKIATSFFMADVRQSWSATLGKNVLRSQQVQYSDLMVPAFCNEDFQSGRGRGERQCPELPLVNCRESINTGTWKWTILAAIFFPCLHLSLGKWGVQWKLADEKEVESGIGLLKAELHFREGTGLKTELKPSTRRTQMKIMLYFRRPAFFFLLLTNNNGLMAKEAGQEIIPRRQITRKNEPKMSQQFK